MITVTEKTSYDLDMDLRGLTKVQVDAIFEAIEEFCCENALDDQPVWETVKGVKTDFCMTSEQADVLRRKIQQAINGGIK